MMTVTIDTVIGNPPFNVWVANGCETSSPSIFIVTITSLDIPYTFTLPIGYQNSGFCVKTIDVDNCVVCECFGIVPPTPSPGPSDTPPATPTPSITPSVTPTGACLTPTYFYGSFSGNGFSASATYTLSNILFNGRPQWVSPSNGTILFNGVRWEVSNWNLAGTLYYNLNFVTINAPDITNWVYQGCVNGFQCSVSFTTSGCGQPPTPTPTGTPRVTPSVTPTDTPPVTPSVTPTDTPSVTPSVTPTDTPSVTPSVTPTDTPSVTPSVTPTSTPPVTPSVTPTSTPPVTPSVTPTDTPSVTPTVTPSSTSGVIYNFYYTMALGSSGMSNGKIMFSPNGSISSSTLSITGATDILVAREENGSIDRTDELTGVTTGSEFLITSIDNPFENVVLTVDEPDPLFSVAQSFVRFPILTLESYTNEPPFSTGESLELTITLQ